MKLLKLPLLFFSILTFSLNAKDIQLTETSNQFVITSNSFSEFTFVNHLSEINLMRVKHDRDEFIKLLVSGYGENAKRGHGELPVLEELINVPFGSSVAIKIINKEEQVISLSDFGIDNLIFPSQPSLSKAAGGEQELTKL